MKKAKFIILTIILALVSGTVFASGIAIFFVSASSDCTTLDMTYTVGYPASAPPANYGISGTGINQSGTIPASLPQHTVTIAFSAPVADGTSLTLTLVSSYEEDRLVINCVEEPINNYFNDGRVEPFAADHVIFPSADGIKVYTPEGELVLFIPTEDIEAIGIPESGANLLGESLGTYVQIYRLSDGRFQVLIGPDSEGKVHVAYWEGLASYSRGSVETTSFVVR